MNAPYRDASPTAADDDDVPDFGNRAVGLGPAVRSTALRLLVLGLGAVYEPASTGFCVAMGGAHCFALAIAVLEPHIRAWSERRHARAVIEGVAALEAKANASARQ